MKKQLAGTPFASPADQRLMLAASLAIRVALGMLVGYFAVGGRLTPMGILLTLAAGAAAGFAYWSIRAAALEPRIECQGPPGPSRTLQCTIYLSLIVFAGFVVATVWVIVLASASITPEHPAKLMGLVNSIAAVLLYLAVAQVIVSLFPVDPEGSLVALATAGAVLLLLAASPASPWLIATLILVTNALSRQWGTDNEKRLLLTLSLRSNGWRLPRSDQLIAVAAARYAEAVFWLMWGAAIAYSAA